MKTGIIIITFNIDTRIFLLQVDSIRKYCNDDFEIDIIDNSSDNNIAEAIQYHSKRLELNYKRTISRTSDSSGSHSFAANLSYQLFKDKYDIFFYLDHDCIPVKPFSCEAILKDKLLAGLRQEKTKSYFWPGCFMFKKEAGPVDFSINREYQLDTGGNTYKLIEKYGEDQCTFFSEAYMQNELNEQHNFFSNINDTFWHCIGGSNWFKVGYHEERINSFINAVTQKMGE